jgi:TrmH family RNA methyltransferase
MQKVSKIEQKQIKSLKYKKYRYKYGLFVVEGVKVIKEFLNSNFKLEMLYSTEDVFKVPEGQSKIIDNASLKSISFLSTPQIALALFKIKEPKPLDINSFTLALDTVNDPGNLGTIIRLCDWFDVRRILCTKETVDCYNPKVVQATMGSLARVDLHYVDLTEVLQTTTLPIYASDMHGESLYDSKLSQDSILVMGNESHGVSEEISNLATALTIPKFGMHNKTESLNVAMATSIMLSEFKRRSTETKN